MSHRAGVFVQCNLCGQRTVSMRLWIAQGQHCRRCGQLDAAVYYDCHDGALQRCFAASAPVGVGMWRYRDVLPVEDVRSIVTLGEGAAPIERCAVLEQYAAEAGIDCRVYVHRHDQSPGSGTFKDLAGSLLATVLKECKVRNYVAASTGNIGVALARYLAEAGVGFWAFLPRRSPTSHDLAIRSCGQNVIRVDGDYAAAKMAARRFAESSGFVASPGGLDPLRLEAKKTIAFEWLRQLEASPTVYVQALSGGTGPLGIAKGFTELVRTAPTAQLPRFYLIQTDQCAPMATAWRTAQRDNFPAGWSDRYPVLSDPHTDIPTLATGNPKLYPHVARLVRATQGQILAVAEGAAQAAAALMQNGGGILVGQAAAVAVCGFLELVKRQDVQSGDTVVVAIGDGIERAPVTWRRHAFQTASRKPHWRIDPCSRFFSDVA